MDNKCKKALQMILFEYIKTSQPVSSKQLSSKCGYASSSIRNWMSKLEESGYLENLHTSSGRVPTDKAWRFYIDEIFELQKYIVNDKDALKKKYLSLIKKNNDTLIKLSKIFFYILKNSDYNILPKPEKVSFKEIILNLISKKMISVIILSSHGFIKDFNIEISESISKEFLEEINEILNKLLIGVNMSDIKNKMITKLDENMDCSNEKKAFIKRYFENICESDNIYESTDIENASKVDNYLKEIEEILKTNSLKITDSKSKDI